MFVNNSKRKNASIAPHIPMNTLGIQTALEFTLKLKMSRAFKLIKLRIQSKHRQTKLLAIHLFRFDQVHPEEAVATSSFIIQMSNQALHSNRALRMGIFA
jgi:hypothetical protein